MLTSSDGTQTDRSGYAVLSEYVPGARLIAVYREERRLHSRIGSKLLSQLTISRWYRPSSGLLELQAAIAMARGAEHPVHVLWGERDLGYLDVASRLLHGRLICSFHTCPDTLPSVIRSPRRLQALSSLVLMSRCQYRFFADAGISPKAIHVVLHGIDTSYFRPVRREADGGFTVLFIGAYRRDFNRLARICAGLESEPGIRVRMAVPPGVHHRIPKLKNVTLLSRLSGAELRAEYQHAGCLLMPVEDATANNAILEAMACGLPVIADDAGGIPEYLGKNAGVLIKSRSVDEFVRAIVRLKSSASGRQEMALAARARAEELDWAVVARQMMDLYRGANS